jgi:hypothetical protein
MQDRPIPLHLTPAADAYLQGYECGVTITAEDAVRARAWAHGLLAATERLVAERPLGVAEVAR